MIVSIFKFMVSDCDVRISDFDLGLLSLLSAELRTDLARSKEQRVPSDPTVRFLNEMTG